MKWRYTHNCNMDKKGWVLIIWNSTYWSNIIMHTNDQYISCILHNDSGLSLICTVIYAHNLSENRKDLWHYICEQAKQINLPWIIMGHFNAILFNRERIDQGIYNSLRDLDFLNFIDSANLTEPNFTGIVYIEGWPYFFNSW